MRLAKFLRVFSTILISSLACVGFVIFNGENETFIAKNVLDEFFSKVSPIVQILIVDEALLKAIFTNSSIICQYRVKVAVNRNLLAGKIAENEDLLDIIYYDAPKNVDYWTFTDSDGTERAMLPFKMKHFEKYSYPERIDHFLQDWEYSRLLKCANALERPENTKRVIPLSYISHLAKLRDYIKAIDNTHMIAYSGTLLGWHRECSFTPHTTDVDFAIRSEEYSPKIVTALKSKQSPYSLFRIYGLPDDSYELSVTIKKTKPRVNIDLFSLYTTRNESWVGGLAWFSRQKYKWSYPRLTEFCTGDLLGHLIYVPCDVEEALEAEYGEWERDKPSKNYTWYKSAINVSPNGKFTKEQMKKMRYK